MLKTTALVALLALLATIGVVGGSAQWYAQRDHARMPHIAATLVSMHPDSVRTIVAYHYDDLTTTVLAQTAESLRRTARSESLHWLTTTAIAATEYAGLNRHATLVASRIAQHLTPYSRPIVPTATATDTPTATATATNTPTHTHTATPDHIATRLSQLLTAAVPTSTPTSTSTPTATLIPTTCANNRDPADLGREVCWQPGQVETATARAD